MCCAIYGLGQIVVRMREEYEGGVRGHMNELAKNTNQQHQVGLAEWVRAGTAGQVVMGSNPAWSLNFFFPSTFENFLSFFGGLVCRYSKR